jgi:hypothetical protein
MMIMRFTYDIQEQRKIKILEKVLMEFTIHMKDVFMDLDIPNTPNFEYELYGFIIHLVNIK